MCQLAVFSFPLFIKSGLLTLGRESEFVGIYTKAAKIYGFL